jgi:hypothetical protein
MLSSQGVISLNACAIWSTEIFIPNLFNAWERFWQRASVLFRFHPFRSNSSVSQRSKVTAFMLVLLWLKLTPYESFLEGF